MSYTSMPNTFTATGGTSHSTLLTGLADGQSYTRYVRCQDGAGNVTTSDYVVSFSVGTGVPASIASVQAAFAAEPMRGPVYYYCDCGPGAEGDCVAGNDANAGTSSR